MQSSLKTIELGMDIKKGSETPSLLSLNPLVYRC